MGSIHNDLHTWAYRARKKGRTTIEIDVETADRACEKIVELSNRVMDLEHALRAQPQAREDAQPVAVSAKDMVEMTAFANNHGTVEDWAVWCRIRAALTTHPAPDTLRAVESEVELIESIARAVEQDFDTLEAAWPQGKRGSRAQKAYDQIKGRWEGVRACAHDALAALQAEQKGGAA